MFRLKKKKDIQSILRKKTGEELILLQSMFSYSLGKMETEEMRLILFKNQSLVKEIFLCRKLPITLITAEWEYLQNMINYEKLTFEQRTDFYTIVANYFRRQGILGDYYNKEIILLDFLLEAFPNWIYPNVDYFLPIMKNEMPKELSREKQLEWCKNKILLLYQYKDLPPEWVQEDSWPIYNGKPMLFTHQVEKDERTTYYFIDVESGQEQKIVQFT